MGFFIDVVVDIGLVVVIGCEVFVYMFNVVDCFEGMIVINFLGVELVEWMWFDEIVVVIVVVLIDFYWIFFEVNELVFRFDLNFV